VAAVFVSVGRHATALQRQACEAVLARVAAVGLQPQRLLDADRAGGAPLPAIHRRIEACHGTLVLAHARYAFERGDERVHEGATRPLHDVRLPTVWNHIEAAFACARGHPLLVVCEHGLRADGLLEDAYGWPVHRIDFHPDAFAGEDFTAVLLAWKARVLAHAAQGGRAGDNRA
jgi:hypothetical protein